MKKFFGFIVLALFICLPLTAKATISIKDGMKCTELAQDSEGKYYSTCTLTATTTENEPLSSLQIDLTFNEPSNIEEIIIAEGTSPYSTVVLGTTINFTTNQPQPGKSVELGKFTYYVKDPSKSCSFKYTATGADIDEPEQTIVVEKVENPQTGSAISYIAIGAGIILVAGAFIVSRKNTKMYKI